MYSDPRRVVRMHCVLHVSCARAATASVADYTGDFLKTFFLSSPFGASVAAEDCVVKGTR